MKLYIRYIASTIVNILIIVMGKENVRSILSFVFLMKRKTRDTIYDERAVSISAAIIIILEKSVLKIKYPRPISPRSTKRPVN